MPLPLILGLLGAGFTLVGLGSRGASIASRAFYPITGTFDSDAARVASWANLVESVRGSIPAWFMYGQIFNETRGTASPTPTTAAACKGTDPNDCASLKNLPGCLDERGLWGISRAESCSMGADHARTGTDPAYALQKGVAKALTYAAALQQRASFATADDLWRAVYFVFAAGAGTANKFIPVGASGLTWADIVDNVQRGCAPGGGITCRDATVHTVSVSNDRVWSMGHIIDAHVRGVALAGAFDLSGYAAQVALGAYVRPMVLSPARFDTSPRGVRRRRTAMLLGSGVYAEVG